MRFRIAVSRIRFRIDAIYESVYAWSMLKDMIELLIGSGMTQIAISRETGIPQPTISRLLNEEQHEVGYSAGKAIEALVCDVKQRNAKEAA